MSPQCKRGRRSKNKQCKWRQVLSLIGMVVHLFTTTDIVSASSPSDGRQLYLASVGNGMGREHSFRTFEPSMADPFPPQPKPRLPQPHLVATRRGGHQRGAPLQAHGMRRDARVSGPCTKELFPRAAVRQRMQVVTASRLVPRVPAQPPFLPWVPVCSPVTCSAVRRANRQHSGAVAACILSQQSRRRYVFRLKN